MISDSLMLSKHRPAFLQESHGWYREAVLTSSPTLPLGGYVGISGVKEDATPSGLRRIGIRYPG